MNHRLLNVVRLALGATLLLIVPSCRSTDTTPSEDPDKLTVAAVQGEIKLGMSSAAVVEVLGSPNILTTDEERREVWIYDKISTEKKTASRSSYGTLLILGGGSGSAESSTTQRTLTIIIKFDGDQRVRDFAYNYTQF